MTPFDLRGEGRVALITGAANGLGRAVAQMFGTAGYSVMLADIDGTGCREAAEALDERGIAARAVVADVSRSADVERAVSETVETWGRLDFVMNNAGIAGLGRPIERLDECDMTRVLDVDLKGPLHVCKHAVRAQRAQGGGSILNVASISCDRGSPGYSVYSAAKAGLVAMTRVVAREVGRFNIRVNCLSPGSILGTNLMAATLGELTEERRHEAGVALVKKIPLGRPACPDDIASVALFLASPWARHIHGAVVTVDGGESLT